MGRSKPQQKKKQTGILKLDDKGSRSKLIRDLQGVITNTQRKLNYDTLRCETRDVAELAEMLFEMAEDLHCEIGLWAAYEQYNLELFGTELPLTPRDTNVSPRALHPDRLHHFLWVMYPVLIDGLIISPDHRDLRLMADECSNFLSEAISTMPKTSTHGEFLQTPNDRAWDVKKKLVWLGTRSFLFRQMFVNYMAAEGVPVLDIPHTDDFICMQCTPWSGMAAIDVLARVLNISTDDVADLTSWYERHLAFYRIIVSGRTVLQARNVINGQRYTIRMDQDNPFEERMLVFGSLVPWRGEWYWSGQQNTWNATDADRMDVAELKQDMKRKSSGVVCRYDLEYREQVMQQMVTVHADSLAYYRNDLISFPDGLAMTAEFEKELKHQWDSRPQEQVQNVIEKHGLHDGRPRMNYPREIVEHSDGIGVFLNPAEGKEMMLHFKSLVSALQMPESAFSEDQEHAMRGFLTESTLSPAFVKRVLAEYGDQAIHKVFLLEGDVPLYWLDYLLRRYKGQFFRRRYPALVVI